MLRDISTIKHMDISDHQKVKRICDIQLNIKEIDITLVTLSADKNASIIREHYYNISETGTLSTPKMWGLKKKLNLKNCDVPTAKTDQFGNLVTNKQSLLKLYQNEYKERLSPK